jgi:uncharacterized protein (DUF2384 family)
MTSDSNTTSRAKIVQEAITVFGDAARACNWLDTPSVVLGGTPWDLVTSDAGFEAVSAELTRIHFGDLA